MAAAGGPYAGGDARPDIYRGNRPWDPRQVRNQATEMLNDLGDLRRQLQGAGGEVRDLQSIDEVAKALREMTNEHLVGDPTGLQQLAQSALEKLQRIERDLRRRTDTTNDQLFLSGADEAPVQYRPLVDEYFRELSKKSGASRTGNAR